MYWNCIFIQKTLGFSLPQSGRLGAERATCWEASATSFSAGTNLHILNLMHQLQPLNTKDSEDTFSVNHLTHSSKQFLKVRGNPISQMRRSRL